MTFHAFHFDRSCFRVAFNCDPEFFVGHPKQLRQIHHECSPIIQERQTQVRRIYNEILQLRNFYRLCILQVSLFIHRVHFLSYPALRGFFTRPPAALRAESDFLRAYVGLVDTFQIYFCKSLKSLPNFLSRLI